MVETETVLHLYIIFVVGTSSGGLPSPPESAEDVALGISTNAVCMEPITHVLVCVWELRVCYDSVPLI